jgi:hypothetical protein
VIDYLAEKSIFVNRFWVSCFVRRHSDKLAVQRAKPLEKERHEVSAEDLKAYLERITAHLTSTPSECFWNVHEIGVGPAKHMSPPDVTVASEMKRGSVTVPDIRDEAQLTLLTAISAFGDSTYPRLISKKQTIRENSSGCSTAIQGP